MNLPEKPQENNNLEVTQIIIIKAKKKIETGLSVPTASTGTAIDTLNGIAKTLAQISNIGGGSKSTGGGGVADGIKTLAEYSAAQAFMAGYKAGKGEQ